MTPDGLLDTNVFLHAQSHDNHSHECRAFLGALQRGEVSARLEPLVVHELSYALPRLVNQMSRDDVAAYLLMVLAWPGVSGDKDLLTEAVQRWRATSSLAFVDAYLAAVSLARGLPVYSKNVRELRSQGVEVPDLLPTGKA